MMCFFDTNIHFNFQETKKKHKFPIQLCDSNSAEQHSESKAIALRVYRRPTVD